MAEGRYEMTTKRGYPFFAVSSAMQKAVRRGDARLACYWAIELHESNYGAYLWKRLITISAEDIASPLAKEVWALHEMWTLIMKEKAGTNTRNGARLFPAKAVILMCRAAKSRDTDHVTTFVYDKKSGLSDEELNAEIDANRDARPDIPEYAYDVHTIEGRRKGKTKGQFFAEEFAALKPRIPGLFDSDVPPAPPKRGTGPYGRR